MSNSHPFKFVQLSSVFQWSIEFKRIAFQRYSHIEMKFIQSISPSIILYIEVRHCILNFAHWKENISIRYYSSIGKSITLWFIFSTIMLHYQGTIVKELYVILFYKPAWQNILKYCLQKEDILKTNTKFWLVFKIYLTYLHCCNFDHLLLLLFL